jgi:hypothetical protein
MTPDDSSQPTVVHRRRRFSDVTPWRAVIVLGLSVLGLIAALAHVEWLAAVLVGGGLGSNVPLTKGSSDDRAH